MSGNTILLFVICAMMAAVVLGAAVNYGREFAANLRQPLRTTVARIEARRVQEDQGAGWSPSIRYFVTFATETGVREEYPVSEEEYERLREGQAGTLRTRGNWYRGFRV
ncbi:MAG: DUF2500 domain-containing protein [Capsulimonadales bacterium]|nr:DUF2500 domain-containing protein [Capsulimonadales bacterium]